MENLRTIAQKAGVSKSTVSRVINNEKYVSAEIKDRVLRIIDETGYVPNGNAVKLSKGKNNTIGMTLPYNNSCYEQLTNSILYYAKQKGYQVLLLPTYYEEPMEKIYFSLLNRQVIDGLILTTCSQKIENLEKICAKEKIVFTEKVDSTILPMIYPDRKKIYQQLFFEISKQKKHRVVFTVKRTSKESKSTRDKVNSFNTYFEKAIEGKNYFTGLSGYSEGYRWSINYFSNHRPPDVIFANGDDIAAGIISGLKVLGYIHKKDFQMIGEGNTPYSEILDFSTIDFFPNEIGKAVINYILSEEKCVSIRKEPLLIRR
ncbi:LacI family DNA-binding transcriptional regulator [Liquorilactobacillus mali]|uniref:LacI family DNA-binding transcriptional regulator n=1 Tax=Liquorilactobacillus mali TaxID=1618 RepID=UPI00264CF78D|nr:LacI family DNA-binding transcriptional regulator [Liquorilactobacillus mali]MDN7146120.1 LacI family DNA-binding transcriptional regulator [Liquorilactobacillus mali]